MEFFLLLNIGLLFYSIYIYEKMKKLHLYFKKSTYWFLGIGFFCTIGSLAMLTTVDTASAIYSIVSIVLYIIYIFKVYLCTKKHKLSQDKLNSSEFSEVYLNEILDDGLKIKEHIKTDYKKAIFYNSQQYKATFPKHIDEQYTYIISHMYNTSQRYLDITDDEEKILKIFLQKVSLVRKKYSIYLERQSDGMIRIYYNGCPTGQFNLRKKTNYVRVLRGLNVIDKYDVTYDEILKAINSWTTYCKYQLA